jgi:hypothetical protein
MGSITRSFANNLTTSGVLLPASLTNNSIANVTAYNAAVSTGNMVLVSSATASSSASIEFTLSSTYKEYQFYFINIHPSAEGGNTYFEFNLSTDSGANYNVAKTSTYIEPYHDEAGTAPSLAYSTAHDLAQGTGMQRLITGLGADNDQGNSGYMSLFNPSSTTYVKHFMSNMNRTYFGDYIGQDIVAGYANTTSALTNIKFQISGGANIDDGIILMYGIN